MSTLAVWYRVVQCCDVRSRVFSRPHLTTWSSMLDSLHMVNLAPLRWSPTAQSTGMN